MDEKCCECEQKINKQQDGRTFKGWVKDIKNTAVSNRKKGNWEKLFRSIFTGHSDRDEFLESAISKEIIVFWWMLPRCLPPDEQ